MTSKLTHGQAVARAYRPGKTKQMRDIDVLDAEIKKLQAEIAAHRVRLKVSCHASNH